MTTLPRLELADPCSPFDEAVILIEGREEETITIECTGAAELAERLVRYVNAHDQVIATLFMAAEVLRYFGAVTAAADLEKLSKTIGDAA